MRGPNVDISLGCYYSASRKQGMILCKCRKMGHRVWMIRPNASQKMNHFVILGINMRL